MLLGMLSLQCAQTAYPLIIKIKASDMRLGLIQRRKERVECAKGRGGYGEFFFFLSLARESI